MSTIVEARDVYKRQGFDMRPVYKYSARIYISAVYRFLKIFLKDSFKNLRPLKPSRIIFTEC